MKCRHGIRSILIIVDVDLCLESSEFLRMILFTVSRLVRRSFADPFCMHNESHGIRSILILVEVDLCLESSEFLRTGNDSQ